MSEATSRQIAAALAAALPSGSVVSAEPAAAAPSDLAEAIVTTFVGATSADFALGLKNTSVLLEGADSSGLINSVDVVRPALEAAAGILGTGVLGELGHDDATTILEDSTTEVFELHAEGVAEPIGWFAVRTRANGTVSGSQQFVAGNLSRISNVEMTLTVEVGRTRMAVRDVLGLEPGAVIELDRSAGAPADVMLNGRLIAHGEIVVVDQDYAVRITKILDVAETVA